MELVNSVQENILMTYESDFVIQYKNKVILIEVKSNKSINNISLTRYNEKNDNDISIRFSMNILQRMIKF